MEYPVFVFGTLKEGFPNFKKNKGDRIAGEFVTLQRFPLYLVGERYSPWMMDLPGEGFRVTGQLFRVGRSALDEMDELERVAYEDGYRRVEIEVVDASRPASAPLRAFAYMKPNAQLLRASIRQGPLAEYRTEHAMRYRPRDADSAVQRHPMHPLQGRPSRRP